REMFEAALSARGSEALPGVRAASAVERGTPAGVRRADRPDRAAPRGSPPCRLICPLVPPRRAPGEGGALRSLPEPRGLRLHELVDLVHRGLAPPGLAGPAEQLPLCVDDRPLRDGHPHLLVHRVVYLAVAGVGVLLVGREGDEGQGDRGVLDREGTDV